MTLISVVCDCGLCDVSTFNVVVCNLELLPNALSTILRARSLLMPGGPEKKVDMPVDKYVTSSIVMKKIHITPYY